MANPSRVAPGEESNGPSGMSKPCASLLFPPSEKGSQAQPPSSYESCSYKVNNSVNIQVSNCSGIPLLREAMGVVTPTRSDLRVSEERKPEMRTFLISRRDNSVILSRPGKCADFRRMPCIGLQHGSGCRPIQGIRRKTAH